MSLTVVVGKEELVVLEELKQLRKEHNVKLGDLARELGMSQGQLSMHESGIRGFTTYTLDAFEEDYRCAVDKILTFNREYEVGRDGLVWKKVTPERLTKANQLYSKGRNIIQISMELGVDEFILEKLLGVESVEAV